MKTIPLSFPFCLALSAALFSTLFFPTLRLFAFAPFLAFLLMRASLVRALFLSLACGLIIDLISSGARFGVAALCATLTTFLLYKQRRHFFEDKTYSLTLLTALVSVVMTALSFLLLYAFDKPIVPSLRWLFTDLICMPLVDALYAFLWFTCPFRLVLHVKKYGWNTLSVRRDES